MRHSKEINEVEEEYQRIWKDIVENSDGSINKEQLKKELFDFSRLIENVPLVYDHISGGAVSKPLTDPQVVKALADEHYEEFYKELNNQL